MPLLARHRFSVQDYYRMAETGVLRPDARVELLEGEIVEMSPIGPFHGSVTKHLNALFSEAARGRWITSVQDPVRIAPHSEPEPDIALLRPAADYYRKRHPEPEEVFLIVEVADSSFDTDEQTKLPIYGRAGIPEVWIVNLNDLTIEVHREPHFTGYGARIVLREGDTAAPLAFPDAAVDVGELLRR